MITAWRDLTVGYDSRSMHENHQPALPVDPKSQMITVELDNDVRFTTRGSGTEPKIKLYIEARGLSEEEARTKTLEVHQCLIQEWFPERWGLKSP